MDYTNTGYSSDEALKEVCPNWGKDQGLIDAAIITGQVLSLYGQHQESKAHQARVDALPPAQQEHYYAVARERKSRGGLVLVIGLVLLLIGIIGGDHLPGNGAVFNVVGILLAFYGLARVIHARGD